MKNSSAFHPDECGFSSYIPSEKYVINQAFVSAMFGILFVPTILLNGISIIAIRKCPQLKGKVCNFVILILSSIDLATGVIGLPLQMVNTLLKDVIHIRNKAICWTNYVTSYFLVNLSILTLYALSFERYMGVVHPFVHRPQVTKKRIFKYECSASLVILAVIFSMPESIIDIFETKFMFVEALFSFVFLSYVYTRIFVAAKASFYTLVTGLGMSQHNWTHRK